MRRAYSICAAEDETLRVAIKRVDGGVFSAWAHETLAAGATLEVAPPEGRFVRSRDARDGDAYLGFAAGSGITPLLSIVATTLAREPKSRFTLVYGNRSSSSVIFREELAELKDRYRERLNLVYVMSREQQDIDLFNGRITREKCDQLFAHWIRVADHDVAFVCGPETIMQDVAEALQAHGMPKSAIKIELFAASIPKHQHVAHARPCDNGFRRPTRAATRCSECGR